MKFYETSDYIGREIAQKEKEIKELKRRQYGAQVREFYWHINNQMDAENPEFLESAWAISFMGKSIELANYADVYQAFHTLLIEYMEENEIEYSKEEAEQ